MQGDGLMVDPKTWVITLSGTQPIHIVAEQSKAAGLKLRHVLEHTGIVVGFGTEETASRLRNIPGIADVSEDQPIDIGPPGDPTS
jgi:hypothetical protein